MNREKQILSDLGFAAYKIRMYEDVAATPYENDICYYCYKDGSNYIVGRRNRKTQTNEIIQHIAQ